MEQIIVFTFLCSMALFAADDQNSAEIKAREEYFEIHPEMRYQPRTARRINLFAKQDVRMVQSDSHFLKIKEERIWNVIDAVKKRRV